MISTGARYIGTIIPDVTVEEVHSDTLRITDHPVETGAAISDHAFHLPYEVQMRIGFSDSTHQAVGFVKMIYQTFIALQQSREPFSVSTGKRLYSNMLIQSMQVTTDEASEYSLNMTVQLREIIITNTQATQTPTANQATPSQTASQSDQGSQSVDPPTNPTGVPSFPSASSSPGWQPGDEGPPPPSPPSWPTPPAPPAPPIAGPEVDPWNTIGTTPSQVGSPAQGIPQNATGSAEMPFYTGAGIP
jgi:hypothetical protein